MTSFFVPEEIFFLPVSPIFAENEITNNFYRESWKTKRGFEPNRTFFKATRNSPSLGNPGKKKIFETRFNNPLFRTFEKSQSSPLLSSSRSFSRRTKHLRSTQTFPKAGNIKWNRRGESWTSERFAHSGVIVARYPDKQSRKKLLFVRSSRSSVHASRPVPSFHSWLNSTRGQNYGR